ncbi:hypothetical protein GQ457_09G023690 [Hibiscus cannabinus]
MGELQRRQRQPHMAIARRVTTPMTHVWPTPLSIFTTDFSFLMVRRSYSSLLDLKVHWFIPWASMFTKKMEKERDTSEC